MLIKEWMTQNVVTITPDTSMMKASRLLREKKIGRLPVVDDTGRVIGIISDRDVKEASPSKATTLDMHELHYLLSELKVKDIMTKKPFCVKPEDSIESVALKMIEMRVGGMPVVDGNGKIQGIITDSDLFKVLIEITGIQQGGIQFAFDLANEPGTLKPIVDVLRAKGARIVSVLTATTSDDDSGKRRVYIRIRPVDNEDQLIAEIGAQFPLLYSQRTTLLANSVHA